ncbi:hypothetical protein JL722_14031 [Aureococcus anophagefferens]|nr:hypothetical protein JL722_14031 [Aureococcus anophagefferens]
MGCTMVLHTCADEACCCRVENVEPGGRAAAAGVKPGDVLLEANGCVPPDDDGASEAALRRSRTRAMDVRTATAVAMTPALVQRLSSWAPDDELLETVDGRSRA